MKEWKKKCGTIKAEYAGHYNDAANWEEQQATYKPTTESWWCGCRSFNTSPNHICKHLIRAFIGDEGLRSNRPPMPFYGEVWRQTVSPVLWVKGVHSNDRLYVRDLRPDPVPPVLTSTPADTDPDPDLRLDPAFDIEAAMGDSDDDEDEEMEAPVEEEGLVDGDQWGGEGFSGFDKGDEGDEDAATAALFAERESLGDLKKDKLELMRQKLLRVAATMEDVLAHPSGHDYVHEVPDADDITGWLLHTERLDRVRNARVLPTTFGPNRRGNIFAQIT